MMAGVPGQGRKFDVDTALDAAMKLFWRHGYEGTSVAELTKAMGISPPSLYKAFGDKRQLFDRVVEHYFQGPGAWMNDVFDADATAGELVSTLLLEAARHYADPHEPGGCLVINAGSTATDPSVVEALRRQRNSNIDRLESRLTAGVEAGELPPDFDSRAIAEFIGATVQGMSVRARDGASVAQLEAAASIAARALDLTITTS
jgi:AcrR family transcriptional regulator